MGSFSSLDDQSISKLAKAIAKELAKYLPTVEPALLNVKDAGVYLGRSKQAMDHLIAKGVFPVVRYGTRIHLRRTDLDKWIESNRV